MLQKKLIIQRTYTDISSKISFTNLVNNFESKISKSKLPNTSFSSKSKLVLSTPTKRGKGLHIDIKSESKVICSRQIADNWSELNHGGRRVEKVQINEGGLTETVEVADN